MQMPNENVIVSRCTENIIFIVFDYQVFTFYDF